MNSNQKNNLVLKYIFLIVLVVVIGVFGVLYYNQVQFENRADESKDQNIQVYNNINNDLDNMDFLSASFNIYSEDNNVEELNQAISKYEEDIKKQTELIQNLELNRDQIDSGFDEETESFADDTRSFLDKVDILINYNVELLRYDICLINQRLVMLDIEDVPADLSLSEDEQGIENILSIINMIQVNLQEFNQVYSGYSGCIDNISEQVEMVTEVESNLDNVEAELQNFDSILNDFELFLEGGEEQDLENLRLDLSGSSLLDEVEKYQNSILDQRMKLIDELQKRREEVELASVLLQSEFVE